ncbi:MAG TPA: tripartite tricarboxylate transporter TctB family protein [Nocardioidaceae bacterium]|nr:tripartite tricarboxylate transporter TctB family protein [Nocardioidaceae bacterium]
MNETSPNSTVEHEDGRDPDNDDGSRLGPLFVGVGMVIVGVVLLRETFGIVGDGFDPQGPRFFPLIVVASWLVLSALYLGMHALKMLRGRSGMPAESFDHLLPVVLLVVILVIYAYVLDGVGYWIATSVFFVASARALGSRNLARDCTVGVVMSVAVYLVFTQGLGVRLPEGIIGL